MSGHGERSRVALTFDMEHPSRGDQRPDAPARLLDTLSVTHTRASFFVQGRWARSHPALARRVVDEGHLLGSHSHFHAPLPFLSDDGVRADLASSAQALEQVTGADPRPWFRCPFGAGHDDPRILGLLREAGYRNVHWNVDPADWEVGRAPDEVVDSVVAGVREVGDGAIVLLHTWPAATPQAVPTLIERLAADGASFVGVDELVDAVLPGSRG